MTKLRNFKCGKYTVLACLKVFTNSKEARRRNKLCNWLSFLYLFYFSTEAYVVAVFGAFLTGYLIMHRTNGHYRTPNPSPIVR